MSVPTPHDDGFHEIQLNGKQLVFLFMAATVVSVVVFLSGVMVGRGVRATRGTVAQAPTLPEAPAVSPASQPTALAVEPGADPTAAAPPQPVDDLSYFDRLEGSSKRIDDLKPPSARSASKPVVPPAPPPPQASTKAIASNAAASTASEEPAPAIRRDVPPPRKKESASPATPAADGFAVQVAAVNIRSDADAIVKRLATKGYTAYVQVPSAGSGSVFRVRVGTFPTRQEADVVAAKLQKEEQIKPWVTR